jgi:hypothetical protein
MKTKIFTFLLLRFSKTSAQNDSRVRDYGPPPWTTQVIRVKMAVTIEKASMMFPSLPGVPANTRYKRTVRGPYAQQGEVASLKRPAV